MHSGEKKYITKSESCLSPNKTVDHGQFEGDFFKVNCLCNYNTRYQQIEL